MLRKLPRRLRFPSPSLELEKVPIKLCASFNFKLEKCIFQPPPDMEKAAILTIQDGVKFLKVV